MMTSIRVTRMSGESCEEDKIMRSSMIRANALLSILENSLEFLETDNEEKNSIMTNALVLSVIKFCEAAEDAEPAMGKAILKTMIEALRLYCDDKFGADN